MAAPTVELPPQPATLPANRLAAPDEVLTADEAAAFLKVPTAALIREAATGRVPGQPIAGEWRFSRRALLRWLRSGSPAPAPLPPAVQFTETPEEQEAFLEHLRGIRKSWGTVGEPEAAGTEP